MRQRGYSVIELIIGVLLILILVFVLVRLAPS
jgi:prepilin-type N-terminal cleavage/methylation domain-containing protein